MLFDSLNKDFVAAYKARDMVKKDVLSSIISTCKYKKVEKVYYKKVIKGLSQIVKQNFFKIR